jgi:hypothetical protein
MSYPIGRRVVAVLTGTLLAATLFAVAGATRASASDAYPCHSPRLQTFKWRGYTYPKVPIRICPLISGGVPVYQSTAWAAPIVGYLKFGGNANWFVAEKRSRLYKRGNSFSRYWASTMADNGKWGWVSEIYFRGGFNDEDDAGLLFIPNLTSYGDGVPTPPWWQR